MTITILITGATDGIGLATAELLHAKGLDLLLHGRSEAKLERTRALLNGSPGRGRVTTYCADLSSLASTRGLVDKILREEPQLDALINNAGVFAMADPRTDEGLDARFAVNTLAPYVLACGLAGRLGPQGRIVNLSSAAQAPVSIDALTGRERLSDDQAYAQSKLALTMWTRALAAQWDEDDPLLVAVNPGSLLASKMVREAYGMQGKDIGIGADILTRAALSDEFASASGQYFDNDRGRFAVSHPDALDPAKVAQMMDALEGLVAKLSG